MKRGSRAAALAVSVFVVSADGMRPSNALSSALQDPGSCLGLPRNTLLASCPAPCLPDSACIVYDQDAEHTALTGCDYNTAGSNSFCWSKPTQPCEFQCLARNWPSWAFRFTVQSNSLTLGKPSPRAAEDPRLLETAIIPYQSPTFLSAIGQLVLSKNITEIVLGNTAVGASNIDVDPAILSRAPSVTSLTVSNIPLGTDRVAAIVASAPPAMKKLEFANVNLTALSWTTFAALPNLETLKLTTSSVSLISGKNCTLPAMKLLTVSSFTLTGFDVQAPKLNQLVLEKNNLVRIPESVFTYSELQYLFLSKNPIYRPLVLTARQVQFLEGLTSVVLKLVDPPDQVIVSRLPISGENNYGNYTDSVDLRLLLEGATDTLLRKDPLLPVRVVDSKKAATYNNLLELRARYRTEPTDNTTAREGSCIDLPRNTLLASCPAPCQADSPCIVYDQDAEHTKLTGCDYGSASVQSFCWSKPAQTCEFHCFEKNVPTSIFAFWVLFKSDGRTIVPRTAPDPSLVATPSEASKYQTNDFVAAIGTLNLSTAITAVDIQGAYSANQTVDVAVDLALLANSPSVTSLRLWNIPLGIDRLTAIMASAPAKLKVLNVKKSNVDTLPWTTLQNLESLYVNENQISSIAGGDIKMPALNELQLARNKLNGFDLQAPKLLRLDLQNNRLVRIPDSVFSYSNLQYLDLSLNPIFRPLVLTAQQVQFLEALPELKLELVNPPDQGIVSRFPTSGGNRNYGNYTDSVDISLLLEEATETLLRKNSLLPVRVVDSEKASTYNNLLEIRARARGMPTFAEYGQGYRLIPENLCDGVLRHTLISNCVDGICPTNGACIAYDQYADLSLLSGCDYDVASTQSACLLSPGKARTCEFQCFGAYEPQSQFKFFIPFQSELGQKIPRPRLYDDMENLKVKEIPFLSNSFINRVGVLNLTQTVTEVVIAGGRSEKASRGRLADVVVSTNLLQKAPSVTSLSLLNIDLSKSMLGTMLTSFPPALKSLSLRNTNIVALPEESLATMKQFSTLTLAQNYLTIFDTKATTLSKLRTLDLSENALTTITIDAPNLEILNLQMNNLVRIPPSVFSLTALDTLDLANNLFTFPLVLSPSQAEFLNSVPNLRLSQLPRTESLAVKAVKKGVMAYSGAPSATQTETTAIPLESALDVADDASQAATPRENAYVVEIASLLASGGQVATVRDVQVIIVSEQIANQYNDRLEQRQKESTPALRTRLDVESTPGPTSSGVFATSGSQQEPSNQAAEDTAQPNETTDSPSYAVGSNLSSTREKTTTPSSTQGAETTSEASGLSLTTKLMLAGVGSAFFVVVVVLFTVLTRRRATTNKASPTYLAMTSTVDGSSALATQLSSGAMLQWWKDDIVLSHRLNASEISDVRVIGSADSGIIVWLVNYSVKSRKLVSKRVVQGEGAAYDAKVLRLVTEAKIVSTLRYATIVPFVGVTWTSKTDLQVLYEYMNNGDLGSYLARTDASTLLWLPEKLQLAIDIIEALVFTHSFNPPLLHRNLKASSVLLDDDHKAKLGGFGCVRPESESSTMTASGVGSGRWLAPEILLGSTSYCTSSDIYSFGVVLCELDTHQVPYTEDAQEMPEPALLQRVARGELRPIVSASCPSEIRGLADACLAFDPVQRPTAMQVAHKLRSLRTRQLDT